MNDNFARVNTAPPEGSRMSSRGLEKELVVRGLLPPGCRLVEVSVTPNSALVIRYETFVTNEQLGQFADAMKAAADASLADDERNRIALEQRKF